MDISTILLKAIMIFIAIAVVLYVKKYRYDFEVTEEDFED